MSEEKAITKSYLEKAINARAEKRWDYEKIREDYTKR